MRVSRSVEQMHRIRKAALQSLPTVVTVLAGLAQALLLALIVALVFLAAVLRLLLEAPVI